jgi:hypothetical protein
MSMKAKHSAWILFAVVSFGLGTLLGCDLHSRSVKEAKPAGETQPLFTPIAASLAQQKMCDEQAAKKFREYTGGDTTFSSYTSRYDPSVNVCYVRVYYVGGTRVTVQDTVYDAFGGRVYAVYGWFDSPGDRPKMTMCKILIPDKPDQLCKSSTEFNELVEKYFGVAK